MSSFASRRSDESSKSSKSESTVGYNETENQDITDPEQICKNEGLIHRIPELQDLNETAPKNNCYNSQTRKFDSECEKKRMENQKKYWKDVTRILILDQLNKICKKYINYYKGPYKNIFNEKERINILKNLYLNNFLEFLQERHDRIFGSQYPTTKTFKDKSNDIKLISTKIRGEGFADSNDNYLPPGMYRLRAEDVIEVVEELKKQIKVPIFNFTPDAVEVTALKALDNKFKKMSASFGYIFRLIFEHDYSLANIYPYKPKEYVPSDADWAADSVGDKQDNSRRYYVRPQDRKRQYIELQKFDLNKYYLYGGNKKKSRKKKTTRKRIKKSTRKHRKKKKATRKRIKKTTRKYRKKRRYKKSK